jgi:RNase H-fold protein (predicted Holliday junction resolvase)
MNKEYIVAVNQGGNEIIYKKGEIILNEFLISDVTDSTITLEKNNQLYFHNVKANVGAENFVKVVVKMPMMVDNSAAEDSFNSKLVKKSATTQKVKEYVTPEERKKEEAKKFFNINPTTTKK